jgi:hypothetical protein
MIPLFGKEGAGEILQLIIFNKTLPLSPVPKEGLRNRQDIAANKFVANPRMPLLMT